MAYLLDTDTYIYFTGGNKKIADKIQEVGEEDLFISSVSVAELYYGAFKSERQDKNIFKIQRNLEKLQILNFNKQVAKVFGRIKANLMKSGHPVHDMDLVIASTAIYHQHTLVTHNTRHFSVIAELLIEDWS